MKVLIFNGSPRKGNTVTAVNALKAGMDAAGKFEIKEIIANNMEVSPCIACMACNCDSRCVFEDDTNDIMDAIEEADAIIFATPVYWWGVTAQLKLIIDKMYCCFAKLDQQSKKVGLIVIGEAEQDDPQYRIIPTQFDCISDCLGWDMVFAKTYSAGEPGDLAADEEAVKEIEGLWETLL